MIKIMFHAINGIGLGHIFRTLNIAKALRKLINCEILFVTTTNFTEVFEKERFEYVVVGKSSEELKELSRKNISVQEYLRQKESPVIEQIKKFEPDILFFDQAILPNAIGYAESKNIFLVYILREIKSSSYFNRFKDTLPLLDLILIPHEKEEVNPGFWKILNLGFEKKNIFFAGNIFREPEKGKIKQVRKKYKKKGYEFLVTVVSGGGGIADDTKKFFNQVAELAKKIHLKNKKINWLFVKGPLFHDNLLFKDFHVIDYESNMPELFATSDLIISRGGYNSVNEIIAAKTPALVNPGFSFFDSQIERIKRYTDHGFIKIFDLTNSQESLKILKKTLERETLNEMRSKYDGYAHKNGNLHAALRVIKEYYGHPIRKENIAFLRYNIDTVGENFIYEETENLRKYNSFYFCGRILQSNEKLKTVYYQPFEKLSSEWPRFEKKYLPIYEEGINLFSEFIKSKNIKLLHAQFAAEALFFYKLIKKSDLPLIVSIRGYDLFTDKIRFSLPSLFFITSKFIMKSENMKKELIKLGCNPSKVEVVYGGVNVNKIPFKPRKINKNELRIISAGRFVEKKGFDITLKSFKEILKAHPDAKLTLIGEGELKSKLENLIKSLNIDPSVDIKPCLTHKDFIKELYNHDIFILLSKTARNGDKEGIPNVLKEAMASGMPAISTKHSGIPELIKDGITGYLVKENDYKATSTKINDILTNPNKTFEICLNARFWIEKKFNSLNSIPETESIYDNVLDTNHIGNISALKKNKKASKFRADLHLIGGCNCRCIMCDNWKNKIESDFSTRHVLELLDDLKDFGVTYIRFHGQEPTLRKDLPLLIKESKKRGFRVGIKTNALLLNEEKLKDIINFLDDIYLSIDSAFADVHNHLRRNETSFNKNLEVSILAKKYNPKINVYLNSVVTNVNYKTLDKMLDLGKKLDADKVSFVNLNDKNKADVENLKLEKSQFEEFYFKIVPKILIKSLKWKIPVSIDPYFYELLGLPKKEQVLELRNNPDQFKEEIENYCNMDYGKFFYQKCKCFGVLDHITIDWKGNVYPCCVMPRRSELAIGNVFKTKFSELWNTEDYKKYRKDMLNGKCKFKNQCARNLAQTKEMNRWFR